MHGMIDVDIGMGTIVAFLLMDKLEQGSRIL